MGKPIALRLIDIVTNGEPINILCIGTPFIEGDSVGPRIGTILQNNLVDVKIIGTMDNPVIKSNYAERIKELDSDAFILVVDATVGKPPGTWEIVEGPLRPGEGVFTNLPPIGNACVKCYTAITPREVLQCKSYVAIAMASTISTALLDLFKVTK